MSQSDDRRDSSRLPYARQVVVLHHDLAWLGQLRDVSEGGCGIRRPPGWTLVEANVVTLAFFARVGPMVVVGARVAWVEQDSIGFEYHDLQRVPPGLFDLDNPSTADAPA